MSGSRVASGPFLEPLRPDWGCDITGGSGTSFGTVREENAMTRRGPCEQDEAGHDVDIGRRKDGLAGPAPRQTPPCHEDHDSTPPESRAGHLGAGGHGVLYGAEGTALQCTSGRVPSLESGRIGQGFPGGAARTRHDCGKLLDSALSRGRGVTVIGNLTRPRGGLT